MLDNKKVLQYDYDKRTKQNGRSIIEDWKDSPKYDENVLRSDQLYEERAIDVIMDYHHQTGPNRNLQETSSSLPKIDNPKKNEEDTKESVIKIKRPQGGGTVRSIPIKDYQSSIAYNIGTLRRSVAPQLQFESLVSEPEKNIPMFQTKKRKPITDNPTLDVHKRSTLPLAPEKLSYRCNGHDNPPTYLANRVTKCLDTANTKKDRNMNDGKSTVNVCKEARDSNDTRNYIRRSYRRRLSSNCCHKMRECKGEREKFPRDGNSNISTRGHVGQKIIVYEENARRSEQNFDPVVEQRKHRAIGVPLVGMHNACGLPVVASWNEAEIFHPHGSSTATMIGNYVRVHDGSRASSNLHRRTYPKRRAPDPNRSNRTTLARAVKRNDSRRSTVRSSVENNASGKRNRRLSLKGSNRATLSSKNSFKRTVRGGKYTLGRASLTNTLDRKSFKGVGKRRTLYARDDGEEAVQALKNLCLNPLARNESQEDMIW